MDPALEMEQHHALLVERDQSTDNSTGTIMPTLLQMPGAMQMSETPQSQ